MKLDVINKLDKLFLGITDTIKVTCYTSEAREIMKFEMLGHEMTEEDDIIRIIDNTDNGFFTPKTVVIHPSEVNSVTYEDDKSDDSKIYSRHLAVMLKDGNKIELETVAFG